MRFWLLLCVSAFDVEPWRPSWTCRQRPLKDEKFLVVTSAREGMNKNVAMIAEAAQWALELNRTLVEPAVCDSRVISPFDTLRDAGGSVGGLKHGAVTPVSHCSAKKKYGFSAYWDLEDLCTKVPIAPLDEWLTWWRTRRHDQKKFAYHLPGRLANGIRHGIAMPKDTDASILFVAEWFRSVGNGALAGGSCTTKPCMRSKIRFIRSTRAGKHAQKLIETMIPLPHRDSFTCVQWRSELHATPDNVQQCARLLVASTFVAWYRHGVFQNDSAILDHAAQKAGVTLAGRRRLTEDLSGRLFVHDRQPITFFVTDLKPNTSVTFNAEKDNETQSYYYTAALSYVQTSFGLDRPRNFTNEDDDDATHVVGAQEMSRRRRRHHHHHHGASRLISQDLEDAVLAVQDYGLQSLLSQDICAAAPILIMCLRTHGTPCSQCARGLDSGFVSGIYNIRSELRGLSTTVNHQRGIWEWPEPIPVVGGKKSSHHHN